ncbi:MAG: BREX system Lon protease-like protein BrxL [Ignisphaera sp.]|nr:BREX system Lon protease-like protein BrxL [Ignisphaera sp.]
MSDLFAKIKRAFGDYSVDKSLLQVAEISKLPGFVAEYLMTEFSTMDPSSWQERLRKFIRKHYYEASEKEYVKHRLVEERRISIIDELRVWVDLDSGEHRGVVPSIGESDVRIPSDIARRYPMTMITGMWGLIELEYSPETARCNFDGNLVENPVIVVNFSPFQAPTPDLHILRDGRKYFTFEEWLDVLVNTVGYNHRAYPKISQKLTLLSRLLPLSEEGVHIAEFGPKATGKTFMFRNVSRYTRIVVGGMVSPAALFYNLRTGMPGEIAVRDAVVFDEISKVRFQNPDEIIAKLKDFMESRQYERGRQRVTSGSSIVMLGNVEVEEREGAYVPVEDLTYILPKPMRDSALIDRIGGVIPGWELPKIGSSRYHLSQGYGIALDYFSEALHEMRKESLTGEIGKHIELEGSISIRDERAVKRMLSAFMKVLFPDMEFSNSELKAVVVHVVELRQRVREWLHKIAPGEFPKDNLSFKLRS